MIPQYQQQGYLQQAMYGQPLFRDTVYDPPYSAEQIVQNYGPDVAERLLSDPVHRWRAEQGIELIHREPSLEELQRIYNNWLRMPYSLQRISDDQSMQLFNRTNMQNYDYLRNLY